MLFNIVEEKMFSILLGDARSWLLLYLTCDELPMI